MPRTRVVIMGAAGRDFHNFNTVYRRSRRHEVVAFTATQIPNIDGRKYPAKLAGALYPKGIPIVSEQELPRLIARHKVQEVAFSYSDVSNQYVMERAALVNACGARFVLLGADETMLAAKVPVIAVVAVRTGSGKSQTSRKVCSYLRSLGLRVVAVRHPLAEVGLTKAEIRQLSREIGLPTWDRPASPCLSSRFPYGVPITAEGLRKVAAAEQVLKGLGFNDCRVRFHDPIARIEVPAEELPQLTDERVREIVLRELKALGFLYITVDLQGYRTGSLNEGLVTFTAGRENKR